MRHLSRLQGWRLEVLDQAEIVALGIAYDDHKALVVIVPLAGQAATEFKDPALRLGDVINLDVEVNAYLSDVRLRHPLKGEPGRRITH